MTRNRSRFGATPPKGFFGLWLLLLLLWIAANSSVAVDSVVTGALIAAVLAYIFARNSDVWQAVQLSPSCLYHFALYTAAFFVELVRANINMMRYVYSPRIDIKPGVVTIKTTLKSPVGRLALANSIALTPGSLVLDIKGDIIFIHWLDVQTTDQAEATRIIAGPFEKHLEQTFG